MKRRLEAAVVLCSAIALAPSAIGAQQADVPRGTAQERLDRARFIETSERFPMGAIDVYLTVAKDGAASPELRGKAWLAIARCRQQLGHVAEAKAALEAAVTEGGATGEEAKRLLAGGFADPRVQQRLEAAILALERETTAVSFVTLRVDEPPCTDLVLLGEAAVGPLSRLIQRNVERTVVVEAAVQLLVTIGGTAASEVVAELAASPDVVLRRAVIRGANEDRAVKGGSTLVRGATQEPMRSVLLRMTEDPDARLRSEATQLLLPAMNEGELLPLTRDAEPWTRVRAIERAWKLAEQDPATGTRGLSPEFLAVLRAALTDESTNVRKAVANVLDERVLLMTPSGRELWLDALVRPEMRDPAVVGRWLEAIESLDHEALKPVPSAARLLEVARAATAVDGALPPAQQHGPGGFQALRKLIGACVSTVDRSDPWPQEHATLFAIGKVAGWGVIERWAELHARAEDLPVLCEFAATAFGRVASVVVPLAKPALEQPESVRRASVDALLVGVRATATRPAGTSAPDSTRVTARQRSIESCLTLSALGWPEADVAVVEAVAADPTLYRTAVERLVFFNREAPPVATELLARLLVLPAARHEEGPPDELDGAAQVRSQLVVQLAKRGAPNLPSAMAAAYRAGLARATGAAGLHLGNLAPLLLEPVASDRGRSRFVARYADRELAAMVTECAAAERVPFWDDAYWVLDTVVRDDVPVATRQAVQQAIGAALPKALPTLSGDLRNELVKQFVLKRGAGWEAFAIEAIEVPDCAEPLLSNLPSMPAALLPKVVARLSVLSTQVLRRLPGLLLDSGDEAVRRQVVDLLRLEPAAVREAATLAVARVYPAALLEAAATLQRDESAAVRIALAKGLGNVFDRAAVAPLVELLRDPEEGVRTAARVSLDGLHYYFESAQKWERLKAGTSLDATSAAEALVKQARSGAALELRKAAIDSLGTLKVPETLPFLLELMADPDPTLAAAARAAVVKINQ